MKSNRSWRDIENAIRNLDPMDQEDMGEDLPGVADWLNALEEGHDVEGMLEDFGTDYAEAADYLDREGF